MPPHAHSAMVCIRYISVGLDKNNHFVKYNHSNRSQLLKELCVLEMCQVLLNDIEYRISINLECFND